jgi:hypothetical protein
MERFDYRDPTPSGQHAHFGSEGSWHSSRLNQRCSSQSRGQRMRAGAGRSALPFEGSDRRPCRRTLSLIRPRATSVTDPRSPTVGDEKRKTPRMPAFGRARWGTANTTYDGAVMSEASGAPEQHPWGCIRGQLGSSFRSVGLRGLQIPNFIPRYWC